MKFLRKIYKLFAEAKARLLTRKTSVSFHLDRLLMSESELKELLVEEGDPFFNTKLRSCTNWTWKSEPLPLGRSKLEVNAEFDLDLSERIFYSVLPKVFQTNKKKYLKEQFVHFFGWEEGNSSDSKRKLPLLQRFLHTPRSLLFSSLHYKYVLLPVDGDFPLDCVEGGHALTPGGKLACFVKLYRLQKIEYLFKSSIFASPAPVVYELYVKVKERYRDGSLGKSLFAFQGRFLQVHKDNYLLDYWGMGPTVQKEILKILPSDLTKIPNTSRSQDRIMRERSWEHCLTLTEESVRDFMNSDDQASTFSHSHRE